jgi:hypothetical protein
MRNINKFHVMFIVTLLSFANLNSVFAEENKPSNKPLLDKNKFSIGLGVSSNSVSGPVDDEIGYQFFAAYNLTRVNLMDGVDSSVEAGLMDYGFKRDSTGIWATYVVDGKIGAGFGWLARLGLDLGDDSGLMAGVGAGYEINKKMDIRLEYVIRDEVDSLQFNFLYRL